jgi:hypothetical protein
MIERQLKTSKMGSARSKGMSVLLSKFELLFASILPQETFIPDSFPQIVQSQAEKLWSIGYHLPG